jgi:hypothetical protein
MTVTYTNRKGQTYYLHQGESKSGKIRTYFSMESTGDLATAVPQGSEIYEHPNGRVYCRRIPRQLITDEERATIENGIKAFTDLPYTIVDVRKNTIIVYTPNTDFDYLVDSFGAVLPSVGQKQRERISRLQNYEPGMQFVLVDKRERKFVVQRFCYLGSIDDWIDISAPGSLDELAREYLPHLGKESLFDLY